MVQLANCVMNAHLPFQRMWRYCSIFSFVRNNINKLFFSRDVNFSTCIFVLSIFTPGGVAVLDNEIQF